LSLLFLMSATRSLMEQLIDFIAMQWYVISKCHCTNRAMIHPSYRFRGMFKFFNDIYYIDNQHCYNLVCLIIIFKIKKMNIKHLKRRKQNPNMLGGIFSQLNHLIYLYSLHFIILTSQISLMTRNYSRMIEPSLLMVTRMIIPEYIHSILIWMHVIYWWLDMHSNLSLCFSILVNHFLCGYEKFYINDQAFLFDGNNSIKLRDTLSVV